MDKNYASFAVLMLSGLFISPAIASTYVPCDGCSYGQMERTALAHGVGRYVVGNILTREVAAFRIYLANYVNNVSANDLAVNSPQSRLYSDPDDLTPQENTAFSAYYAFYSAEPIGYKKQYNLRIVPSGEPVGVPNSILKAKVESAGFKAIMDEAGKVGSLSEPKPGGGTVSYPTPGVNAYTVVNGGPDQNAFLRWLGGTSTFGITGAMTNAVTSLSILHIADGGKIPGISFTVTFTDGSHIGAYVDSTQLPPQIKVNQSTAVDSYGNTIPPSFAAVAGEGKQNYGFLGRGNGSDLGNMRSQIGSFGIAVPATRRFACTSTPGGTHCVSY
jgi:hypothetical protein